MAHIADKRSFELFEYQVEKIENNLDRLIESISVTKNERVARGCCDLIREDCYHAKMYLKNSLIPGIDWEDYDEVSDDIEYDGDTKRWRNKYGQWGDTPYT